MDFSFSADQLSIQDSMARIFADYCSDEQVKKLSQSGDFFHRELWQQLAAAGVCGLPFSDDELGFVELCLIIELQGRSVAPLPLIPSVVEAGMTIQASQNETLIADVLPGCASGEVILASAEPYKGLQSGATLRGETQGDQLVLNGRSGFISYAAQAGGFVVHCEDQHGAVAVYCAADNQGLRVVTQKAINDEPAGYVQFDSASFSEQNVLARGDDATHLLAAQRQRAWVASAAVILGALDEGLKRTAAYVSERKQFGRALGSFQAVSQQAADAYMELESLRSVYWRALEDIDQAEQFSVSAAVTKYWSVEASHKAAHAVLHLHGGIGQDLDYPIHRFFLFAKHFERYLGSADDVALALGTQILNANASQLEQLCQ